MPENENNKFNSFSLINDKNQGHNVYIASPSNEEYKRFGQLFVLIENKFESSKNDEINKAIISIIDEETKNLQIEKIETAFETALNNLNKKIQSYLVGLAEEWFDNLNLIIGIEKDNNLYFTNIGNMTGFIIVKDKIANIIEPNREKINPLKLFTNVSNGQLPAGCTVFLCTENILDYFSQEKIRKILSENKPRQAMEFIHELLEEQNNNLNFSAISINSAGEKIETEFMSDKSTSDTYKNDSMSALIDKETKTKELLATSIWPSFKKGVKNFSDKIKKDKEEKYTSDAESQPKSISYKSENNKLKKFLLITLAIIKNLLIKIASLISVGIRLVTNGFRKRKSTTIKRSVTGLPNKTSGWLSNMLLKFKKLSVARKVLFVLALVLIILFAWSITGLGQNREKTLQKIGYQETFDEIEKKINEAKAAMLYDNESGARELLAEASSLLSTIPDEKNFLEDKNSKQDAITEQFRLVSHVITINEPTEYVNFNSIKPDIGLKKIFKTDNIIYAFDKGNRSVYQVDMSDKSLEQKYDNSDGDNAIAIDDFSASTLYVLYENNKFGQYNIADDEIVDLDIKFANQDKKIIDINSFSSRIYSLDTKNKQIFRHQRVEGGYSTGENWLSSSEDKLAKAVSMAIDGSIYIIFSDGAIEKYSGGNIDSEFTSPNLDPSLENATKIFTDEAHDYIYLLDPNNKRFIILDKTGGLINQYYSEKFDNMSDFSVDEDNKKVYLLNGTQLFEIDIEI